VIYQLWRFHFNGMVYNLLTTPGAGDSVTAGTGTVVSALLIAALIFAAEVAFGVCGLPRLQRLNFAGRLRTRKALLYSLAGVAMFIFLDKAVYGELISFPHEVFGMVLNLESDSVGCILLGDAVRIKEGDRERIRAVALDAQRQRLQALEEEPRVERAQGRAQVAQQLDAQLDDVGKIAE
jgi:hypothetical protein